MRVQINSLSASVGDGDGYPNWVNLVQGASHIALTWREAKVLAATLSQMAEHARRTDEAADYPPKDGLGSVTVGPSTVLNLRSEPPLTCDLPPGALQGFDAKLTPREIIDLPREDPDDFCD